MSSSMLSRADRIRGCLLGGAVGDAFGYDVEFMSRTEIRNRFGASGIRAPVPSSNSELEVSDDTQMTMFLLEGILENKESAFDPNDCINSVRQSFLRWYKTQKMAGRPTDYNSGLASYACMWKAQAPGFTCLTALGAGAYGTPETPINGSGGCGGVMRAAPCGFVANWDASMAFTVGMRQAALTHGGVEGYVPSGVLAAVIRLLMEGRGLRDSISPVLAAAGHRAEWEAGIAPLKNALAMSGKGDIEELGGGWPGHEALAMAVFAVEAGRQDWTETFAIASTHSGDSDSVASIAGQILGAMKGLSGLNDEWIESLDVMEPLSLQVREASDSLAG